MLSSVPEIVELVQCGDAEKFSHDSGQDGKEKVKQLFESIFSQIMSSNKGIVREAICKLKRRLSFEKKVTELGIFHHRSCYVLNFKACYFPITCGMDIKTLNT